ncbi:uncharacterized protein NPIL_223811 [Nephila pilipes]|uniref:Gustatory receptor n=1 Tax=Nephila pilipes TaxID=299642 RepID=A0A8X6TFT3_NEPPI|nr:uncharacterized protein NPIL_223811 [Nephila pilipes]
MSLFETKVYPSRVLLHKRRRTSDDHPLRPVLNSLSVLGLKIEDSTSPIKRILFFIYFVVVLLCMHYWAISDFVWYFRNRIQEDMLAESVTVWASVCTLDFLMLKRKDLMKVLSIVKKETEKLSSSEQRKYRKTVMMICGAAWLFIILFIMQNFMFSIHVNYDRYFSNTPAFFFYHTMSETQMNIFIRIDRSVENLYIHGLLTMIIALYILMCTNAKLWIKKCDFSSDLHTISEESTSHLEDFRHYRSIFDQFSKKIELLDDVFCLIVAVWLLMILVSLCVRILTVLNPLTENTERIIVSTLLVLSRATITLIAISIVADKINEASVSYIRKLDSIIKKGNAKNIALYQEIQLIYIKYTFFPTHLTVWKFTSINRSFLMTCIGMMSTYVIICIQLNPNALKGIMG